LVGLQPRDRVGDVRTVVEEVLGSCGQKELVSLGRFGCRGDALDGELEVVDGSVGIARCIFDGSAGKADGRCQSNRLRAELGRGAEAVLEVGGDGKMGCVDDLPCILENPGAVEACVRVLASAEKA
jgi:hypothetical protein